MLFIDIILTGIGLAMDAMAVSICKGLTMNKIVFKDMIIVALYFGIQKVGYVKRIHNEVFHLKNSKSLKIKVKKLEQNGHINKAYIIIFSE